jgi:hypothetical protein
VSAGIGLEELRAKVAEYGTAAFLVTVGDAGPHVVSVAVQWTGDEIVVGAGRTTGANVQARPEVSLLWPPDGRDYSLIVDGVAVVAGDSVVIRPGRAVLHRSVAAPGEGPGCIRVLDAERPSA